MPDKSATRHRWTRHLAIGMAVVTTLAILATFSSEYIGMDWLAPAAQIIILAEILGFVVLERFQVFEPVQETIADVRHRLESLERLRSDLAASGYARAVSDVESTHDHLCDLLSETLAEKPASPQILRITTLTGEFTDAAKVASEAPLFADIVERIRAFHDTPESRAKHPWVTSWAIRTLDAIGDPRSLDNVRSTLERVSRSRTTNQVSKILPRPGAQAAIFPMVLGDRAVALGLGDASSNDLKWGVILEGEQYAALFARWFDELWQDPEAITVFARGVVDEQAFARIRQRLTELGVTLPAA